MISPPPPPNRRRRRSVAAVAVLVVGVGWWFWPRVDQRFVGKWSVEIGGLKTIHEFYPNGRLIVRTRDDGSGREFVTHYRWFVIGSRYFSFRDESATEKATSFISLLWSTFNTRSAHVAPPIKIVIDRIEPNQIRLRSVFPGPFDESHVRELVRIPE